MGLGRNLLLGAGALVASTLSASTAQALKPKCPNVLIVLDRSCSMVDLPTDDDSQGLTTFECGQGQSCNGTCQQISGYNLCNETGSKIHVAKKVLNDLLLGQKLELLQPSVLMGIASVAGCLLFAILLKFEVPGAWAGAAAALTAFAVRLLAVRFNVRSRPLAAFEEDWRQS